MLIHSKYRGLCGYSHCFVQEAKNGKLIIYDLVKISEAETKEVKEWILDVGF